MRERGERERRHGTLIENGWAAWLARTKGKAPSYTLAYVHLLL